MSAYADTKSYSLSEIQNFNSAFPLQRPWAATKTATTTNLTEFLYFIWQP